MDSGGFAVDVDGLRSVAQRVAEAATTLREAVREAGVGLAPPPRPGSSAGAAAAAAEQAWLADLRRLTADVDDYSEGLRLAERNYRDVDAASGYGLQRAGAGVVR